MEVYCYYHSQMTKVDGISWLGLDNYNVYIFQNIWYL